IEQFPAGLLVAADHPRLDHGVALPVAPLVLVILFQRAEAHHQRAGGTVRPQAHVHTEDEAIYGWRIQRLDKTLPKADKKLLVIQRAARSGGFATFRVAEDKVDVRRQVEFVGAQLAHAEYNHLLLATAPAPGRHAELLAMARIEPAIGEIDAGIGKVRQVGTGLGKVSLACQVAPDDSYLLTVAKAPEESREARLVRTIGEQRIQRRMHLARTQRALQQPGLGQLQQHLRISTNLFGAKIAGRTDSLERCTAPCRPGCKVIRSLPRDIARRAEEQLLGTTDQWQ